MTQYRNAPHLARPTPAHALTPGAEAARQAVRDFAVRRQAARDEVKLITHHVPPWRQVELDALTGAPATFARAALKAGHEVAAKAAGRAVTVAVRSPRIRATWVDGQTKGAIVDDKLVTSTVATHRLTMPLADAQALAAETAAKAAATRAANKAAKAAEAVESRA